MQSQRPSRRVQAKAMDVDLRWAMWAFLAGFAGGLALHLF
jgi:hypothetical protein